eukprot:jgi/Bigna1/66009/fgenesh1_pg.1_\
MAEEEEAHPKVSSRNTGSVETSIKALLDPKLEAFEAELDLFSKRKKRARLEFLVRTCVELFRAIVVNINPDGSEYAGFQRLLPHDYLQRLSNSIDIFVTTSIVPYLDPGVMPIVMVTKISPSSSSAPLYDLYSNTTLVTRMLLGRNKDGKGHTQLQVLASARYHAILWAALLQLHHRYSSSQSSSLPSSLIRERRSGEICKKDVGGDGKQSTKDKSHPPRQGKDINLSTDRLHQLETTWIPLVSQLSTRGSLEALCTLLRPLRATGEIFNPPPRPRWLRTLCKKYLSFNVMEPNGIKTLIGSLLGGDQSQLATMKIIKYVARAVAAPSPLLASLDVPPSLYVSKVAHQILPKLKDTVYYCYSSYVNDDDNDDGKFSYDNGDTAMMITMNSRRNLTRVMVESVLELQVRYPLLTEKYLLTPGFTGLTRDHASDVMKRKTNSMATEKEGHIEEAEKEKEFHRSFVFAYHMATSAMVGSRNNSIDSQRRRSLWVSALPLFAICAGMRLRQLQQSANTMKNSALLSPKALRRMARDAVASLMSLSPDPKPSADILVATVRSTSSQQPPSSSSSSLSLLLSSFKGMIGSSSGRPSAALSTMREERKGQLRRIASAYVDCLRRTKKGVVPEVLGALLSVIANMMLRVGKEIVHQKGGGGGGGGGGGRQEEEMSNSGRTEKSNHHHSRKTTQYVTAELLSISSLITAVGCVFEEMGFEEVFDGTGGAILASIQGVLHVVVEKGDQGEHARALHPSSFPSTEQYHRHQQFLQHVHAQAGQLALNILEMINKEEESPSRRRLPPSSMAVMRSILPLLTKLAATNSGAPTNTTITTTTTTATITARNDSNDNVTKTNPDKSTAARCHRNNGGSSTNSGVPPWLFKLLEGEMKNGVSRNDTEVLTIGPQPPPPTVSVEDDTKQNDGRMKGDNKREYLGELVSEYHKALAETSTKKPIPTQAHGLSWLRKLIKRAAAIDPGSDPAKTATSPSSSTPSTLAASDFLDKDNRFEHILERAERVLWEEKEPFLFNNAISLMASLGIVRPDRTLSTLADFLIQDVVGEGANDKSGFGGPSSSSAYSYGDDYDDDKSPEEEEIVAPSLKLKISETIAQICQKNRGKEGVARILPQQLAKSLIDGLVSTALAAMKEKKKIERNRSKKQVNGVDDETTSLLPAGSLSALGDFLTILSVDFVIINAERVVSAALAATTSRTVSARRAGYFLLERLLEVLGHRTTKALPRPIMSQMYDRLKRGRIEDRDAAARVLAGRAADALQNKVLR